MHKGVIVAGMHRSGTSAMTRVLNLLGCALPEELIGPNLGNERGHWESAAIVELNDQIFTAAGTSWDDWMGINSDWRASALREEAVLKASALVQQHSQLGPLFVVKDPRISKIVDIWLDAFDKVDVEPTLIIMLRNPIEVANSLERRDLMSPAYGHLLWLRYMLDVELYSRGRKRIICCFDQLLENWSAVVKQIRSSTGLFFPRNSSLIQNEIDQFVDKRDRHHDVRSDLVANSPNLSIWLRDAYAILLKWSKNGEDSSDWSDLDAIRNGFDQSAPAVSRLILPGTQSGLAGAGGRLRQELREQLDQARRASGEAERVVEDSRSRLAEAQAREEALAAQIEQQTQAAQHLEAQIASLRAEVAQVEALNATVAELQSLEAQLKQQLDALQQAAEAAQQDIATERHAREQAEGQLAERTVRAEELQSNEARFSARIMELEQSLGETTQSRDAEQNARIQAEQQLAQTQDALAQANDQLGDVKSRLATAESALIQRREELAQLWEEMEAARLVIGEIDTLREEKKAQDARLAEAAETLLRLTVEQQASREAEQAARSELTQEVQTRCLAEARLQALAEQLAEIRRQRDEEMEVARVARGMAETQLEARFSEVALLTTLLRETSAELDNMRTQIRDAHGTEHRLTELLQRRDEDVAAAEAARSFAERQLSGHFAEVAKLSQLLRETTAELDIAQSQAQAAKQAKNELMHLLQKRDEDVGTAEGARSAVERQLADHMAEATRLTQLLHDAQAERRQAPAKSDSDVEKQLTELLQKRDQDVGAAEAARSVAERQLSARFTEIATLTKLLRDASAETDASKAHAQWLRRVNAAAAGFPRWWAFMPLAWRRKHENARYARKGLFDAEKYLKLYPDVAASGMDPLKHYILHGMDENRRNPV